MATEKTISLLARECSADFNNLHGAQGHPLGGHLKDGLEDSRGRFNVWASNLGAVLQPTSKKSLDSRLENAPLMRAGVLSGLRRLKAVQTRLMAIITGEEPNRTREGSAEGGSSSSTELDELLAGLSAALNHLFGLSVLIRRMRPKGRFRESSNLDDGSPESSRDAVTVKDKFPKLKGQTWLAQRLGGATNRRRQYFSYRQQHRERLGSQRDPGADATNDDGPAQFDTATTIATTFEEITNSDPNAFQPTFDRSSVFTAATSLVSDYDENQEMGRRIPDLPDMTLDGVKLDYGTSIECPYCRTIQSFTNRLEWKRHVFSDLQPYVCTFQDCKTGLFGSRSEWLKHESDKHRRRWQCFQCGSSSEVFTSEADMRSHLRSRHGDSITEGQADILLKACERPMMRFDASACPICDDWEPSPVDSNNAKQFFRHVARHQQQIALEALPLYIDGLDIRDDESAESDNASAASLSDGDDKKDEDEDDDEEENTEEPSREEVLSTNRLFGVSLQGIFEQDGLYVPYIVQKSLRAIEQYGLGERDIWRKAGSLDELRYLHRKFEDATLHNFDLSSQESFGYNIHNVTDLVKEFLQSLPDPPITKSSLSLLTEAMRIEDRIERRDGVHAIINDLPDPHYAVLRAMILHLGRVMTASHQNGMTGKDLAVALSPFLIPRLWNNGERGILNFILEHIYEIFDDD